MNNITIKAKPFPKLIFLGITTGFLFTGVTAYQLGQSSSSSSPPVTQTTPTNQLPEIKTVTALGRLEPKGEVIQLSAPGSTQGNRIEKLLVQEGDLVQKGQIIGVLDSQASLQAALTEAKERVSFAEANLKRVQAGAQIGEITAQRAIIARIKAERTNNIAAQQATIRRLEAEVKNAEIEYQRYQHLYERGAISASSRDNKQLTKETTQRQLEEAKATLTRISTTTTEQLEEAKATLNRIAEIRPVDVAVSTAEVRQTMATVARAQAELDNAYIKAPQAGRILEILTRPGEVISNDGIVTIGQTSQMYAVAEVYESNIGQVQIGQQVTLTSSAISGELQGTVEKIGLKVERQEVINTDPTENIDAKVVEVRVLLDRESSLKVESLTNLSVKVKIIL